MLDPEALLAPDRFRAEGAERAMSFSPEHSAFDSAEKQDERQIQSQDSAGLETSASAQPSTTQRQEEQLASSVTVTAVSLPDLASLTRPEEAVEALTVDNTGQPQASEVAAEKPAAVADETLSLTTSEGDKAMLAEGSERRPQSGSLEEGVELPASIAIEASCPPSLGDKAALGAADLERRSHAADSGEAVAPPGVSEKPSSLRGCELKAEEPMQHAEASTILAVSTDTAQGLAGDAKKDIGVRSSEGMADPAEETAERQSLLDTSKELPESSEAEVKRGSPVHSTAATGMPVSFESLCLPSPELALNMLQEGPASQETAAKRKRKRPAKLEDVQPSQIEPLTETEELDEESLPIKAKRQRRGIKRKSARVGASGKSETAARQRSNTPNDLQRLQEMLAANREPYNHNYWRQKPWPAKPYECIPEYQVAHDAGEEIDKAGLKSKLCISSPEQESAQHSELLSDAEEAAGRVEILAQLAEHHRSLSLKALPPPLCLDIDIQERPAWGLDCYTHRVIANSLSLCKEILEDTSVPLEEACNDFIADHILPAINRQHEHGWNICRALEELAKQSDPKQAAIAKHLLWAVSSTESQVIGSRQNGAASLADKADEFLCWRVHPKGQGIFALRDIPGGTFVSEYLGELYSPWRWFEKQDLLRKRSQKGDLPDFYNICLERPPGVEGGADVIYVEAADRGNFASRLSHSCGPNCRNLAVVVGGSRITNALFALRDIPAGEELCWDYACVTESEAEFRAATCLCASPLCRGSFLYYANSTTFQEVMQRRHNFLDRNAILVKACRDAVDESDLARLRQHGIGTSLLGSDPPQWVVKWASLILCYIEVERQLLPDLLAATDKYSSEATEHEAEGVKENRLVNLAVTLDKVQFFLRHQQPDLQKEPPLHVLLEEQILEFLWTGPQSAWLRASSAALSHLRGSKKAASASIPPSEATAKIAALAQETPPKDVKEAQQRLIQLVQILRQCSGASSGLADSLLILAHTETFFIPTKFDPIRSQIREPGAAHQNGTLDGLENGTKVGKKRESGTKLQQEDSKVYRPPYLWGQCVAWFKQTIFDPTASLSADRRGTLSLPDFESAYRGGEAKGSYCGKPREALLKLMTKLPSAKWPTTLPFSFKNNAKVYGSVMLDAALRSVEAGGAPSESLATLDAKFAAILTELRAS